VVARHGAGKATGAVGVVGGRGIGSNASVRWGRILSDEGNDRPLVAGVEARDLVPTDEGAGAVYGAVKHAFDRLVAAVVLLPLLPVFGVLAWRVRRDSPGPAFFRQERAGRGGKPFQVYKFRTMRTDADPFGDSPQSGSDPRITKIGRFLRETSLDELPQLVNVMRGEMSLVGPRPLYLQQMAEWNARQRRRLAVKPGLTGLAQVSGRGSLTIEEKLELDVQYVERVSLWFDLWILWRTVVGVFRRGDIYEKRYSAERERRSGT
jgi:lipopolysaccharide/colanic/teichoic acid biosynthesis glycosyltransferase